MQPDQITIHCRTDLNFLPIEDLRFGEGFVRALYNELNKPGGYPYKNLNLQENPPTLSTVRLTDAGKSESLCRVQKHSLVVMEDGPHVDVASFQQATKDILKAAQAAADSLKRPCPLIFNQKIRICTLARPSVAASPLDLLSNNASRVKYGILPFKRPPSRFGIKFTFDSHDKDDSDDDDWTESFDDDLTLRFETWEKDSSYILMELNSSRVILDQSVDDEGDVVAAISGNIGKAHEYLLTNGVEFLNQFDTRNQDDDNDDDESQDE